VRHSRADIKESDKGRRWKWWFQNSLLSVLQNNSDFKRFTVKLRI